MKSLSLSFLAGAIFLTGLSAFADMDVNCSTSGTFTNYHKMDEGRKLKTEQKTICPDNSQIPPLLVNADGSTFSNNCGRENADSGYTLILQTQKTGSSVEVTVYLSETRISSDEEQMNLIKPFDTFKLSANKHVLSKDYSTAIVTADDENIETKLEKLNLKCTLGGINTARSFKMIANRGKPSARKLIARGN